MSEKEADLAAEEKIEENVAETAEVNWEEASKEELLEELVKLKNAESENESLKKELSEKKNRCRKKL